MADYKSGTYYYICNEAVYTVDSTKIEDRITCEYICSTVWYQGPNGGVKLIDFKHNDESVCKYVTKDKNKMKEFIWVKLRAEPFRHKVLHDRVKLFLRSIKKGV